MKFIIETSGSSGPPKSVIVDESTWAAMAEVDVVDLEIDSTSVIAVDRMATAILKMFQAKASGSRLAFYPGHEKASMREWIQEQFITHLSTIATTFRWLASGIYKFPSVKVVEIGGEMVDWDDVRLCRERFPNAVFINRYAAVEARIICRKRVERDEPLGTGRMPVGLPVAGVDVWTVPIDRLVGEIVVKSSYLSDGYYNNPELTAAKFKDGCYYTGDKGHWLNNGELMLDGRM